MQNKWILVPVAAAAVGLGGMAFAAGSTSAHGFGANDTMVARLAEAFGKSEEEVTAVLEQVRSENQAERLAAVTAKLDEAVASGQITAEQKELILGKIAENREQKDRGDRKDRRQAHRQEIEAWANEHGISIEFLQTLMGPKVHGPAGQL